MKKDFSFYEFVAVFLPGAVLLGGAAGLYEETRLWITSKDFGASQLGLFIIASYVLGHLLQCLGNLLEFLFWIGRGKPSHWITRENIPYLTSNQTESLPALYEDLTKSPITNRLSLSKKETRNLTGSLFTYIRQQGQTDRIDTFNGNYGLFRGIASGLSILIAMSFIIGSQIYVSLFLIICLVCALIRMNRFGIHYASELYRQAFSIKNSNTPKS